MRFGEEHCSLPQTDGGQLLPLLNFSHNSMTQLSITHLISGTEFYYRLDPSQLLNHQCARRIGYKEGPSVLLRASPKQQSSLLVFRSVFPSEAPLGHHQLPHAYPPPASPLAHPHTHSHLSNAGGKRPHPWTSQLYSCSHKCLLIQLLVFLLIFLTHAIYPSHSSTSDLLKSYIRFHHNRIQNSYDVSILLEWDSICL